MRYPEKTALPEPLPPERRTVGQLIAESIKLYQSHFWWALLLGLVAIPPDLLALALGTSKKHFWHAAANNALVGLAQTPLFSAAFVGATLILLGRRSRSRILRAYLLAVLLYLPVSLLIVGLVLPALAWLAFVGLAVPALVVEGGGLGHALARGVDLARADYAHVLGGICALVILALLCRGVLAALLHGESGTAAATAGIVADVILYPLVFLGSALLYVDQEARLRLRAAAPVTA